MYRRHYYLTGKYDIASFAYLIHKELFKIFVFRIYNPPVFNTFFGLRNKIIELFHTRKCCIYFPLYCNCEVITNLVVQRSETHKPH